MNEKCVHKVKKIVTITSTCDPGERYDLNTFHCSLLNKRIGIQGINCKKCKLKQIV